MSKCQIVGNLMPRLNWHLRDINTEIFPRSLPSLESFSTEQTDEIIPVLNITPFSKFLSVLFCVRALDRA